MSATSELILISAMTRERVIGPKCGGRTMRILAQVHPPETTTAILDWLNLPCRPPPIAAAEPTELAIAMTDADADADAAIDEAFDPPHDSHEF